MERIKDLLQIAGILLTIFAGKSIGIYLKESAIHEKKEGLVRLPKKIRNFGITVVLIGIIFGITLYCITGEAEGTYLGIIFAFCGLIFIIGYVNFYIIYNNATFIYRNFWGLKREYKFVEITGSWRDSEDDIVCVGKRKIRVDEMAVGRDEFLERVDCIFYDIHKINVKSVKHEDIFSGHIANYTEVKIFYIVTVVILIGVMLLMVNSRQDIKMTQLSGGKEIFENYEVKDNFLYLYSKDGLNYKAYMPVDKINNRVQLEKELKDKKTLDFQYEVVRTSDHTFYYIYQISDEDGNILLDLKEVNKREKKLRESVVEAIIGLECLVALHFILMVWVMKNPERHPRLRKFFVSDLNYVP